MQRKPEPVSKELKDTADALSGAIVLLEIMRPASDHANQEFADRFTYTSALNLRLTKQWHEVAPNRGRRIYVADAHFGSVDDAEIMGLHGMHSILTVKGHTRRFPAKELADHCGPNAGDWAVMRTPIGRDPDGTQIYIYAIGHRRGGEARARRQRGGRQSLLRPAPVSQVHIFVSTCGKTVEGGLMAQSGVPGSVGSPSAKSSARGGWRSQNAYHFCDGFKTLSDDYSIT